MLWSSQMYNMKKTNAWQCIFCSSYCNETTMRTPTRRPQCVNYWMLWLPFSGHWKGVGHMLFCTMNQHVQQSAFCLSQFQVGRGEWLSQWGYCDKSLLHIFEDGSHRHSKRILSMDAITVNYAELVSYETTTCSQKFLIALQILIQNSNLQLLS